LENFERHVPQQIVLDTSLQPLFEPIKTLPQRFMNKALMRSEGSGKCEVIVNSPKDAPSRMIGLDAGQALVDLDFVVRLKVAFLKVNLDYCVFEGTTSTVSTMKPA